MLPAPAKTAAGGQKEEMAAAIPTPIEIGAINELGGYVANLEQVEECVAQTSYLRWEGRNLQSEA